MPGWTHPDFTATLRYHRIGGKKGSLKWFIPFLHLSQALADCVQDLLRPFHDDTIDLVAGIDAMGFILGKMATQRETRVVCKRATPWFYFKKLLL